MKVEGLQDLYCIFLTGSLLNCSFSLSLSLVFMYYFDNPGGQIPSWVVNWAAKNGVPNFLKDMVKACQNYRRT